MNLASVSASGYEFMKSIEKNMLPALLGMT